MAVQRENNNSFKKERYILSVAALFVFAVLILFIPKNNGVIPRDISNLYGCYGIENKTLIEIQPKNIYVGSRQETYVFYNGKFSKQIKVRHKIEYDLESKNLKIIDNKNTGYFYNIQVNKEPFYIEFLTENGTSVPLHRTNCVN